MNHNFFISRISYVIATFFGFVLAFFIARDAYVGNLRIFMIITLGVVLSISNITIVRRILLFLYAKKNSWKKIKTQSEIFTLIFVIFYILILGVIIFDFENNELSSLVGFLPLIVSVLLQNILYIGNSEIICFNKQIKFTEITIVNIQKSMLRTYIVFIFNDVSNMPIVTTLSKKYIHNLIKELENRNLKIELKGIDRADLS